MDKVINALLIVIAIASAFVWGCCAGGRHSKAAVSKTETTTDTLWREIHDTCFVERSVAVVRTDTVRLAVANVHENAISGTYTDRYGHENGKSWTHTDTLYIHDSVFVEVPITQRVFIGDNYVITAEGFRVRLTDVNITYPTVTNTINKSFIKPKHWGIGLGAQVGYGYTTKGFAPYAGLGVSFGYIF